MTTPLTFQDLIMRLERFWADQGCVIWQPYNVQVGAGTYNPATSLRVLGPEPWRVAYVEPSVRPDDGRYGENPNRMQLHFQYQVVLKPDPGNPQELYLQSLEALGVDLRRHDVRFVEDNWESPALGAWGLGWEVWLDGQEITQYTYFQQAGSQALDPVSVELTYGLERIALALQDRASVWDIDWHAGHRYGDLMLQSEIEHCRYYFEVASVDALRRIFDTYHDEARHALDHGLVLPAHDYVLKCSHLFNVLDTRGVIGVTERAAFFKRMRQLSRDVAAAYVEQRQRLEYPFGTVDGAGEPAAAQPAKAPAAAPHPAPDARHPFLLEIGAEELPAGDLALALEQLRARVPDWLGELRLEHGPVTVEGTPRRLVARVAELAARQPDGVRTVRGPAARVAFDRDGNPTRAAEGFARGQGVSVAALERRTEAGGEYVYAVQSVTGRPAADVLAEALPGLLAGLTFPRGMRWNHTNVTFSRPIRWLVALLGDTPLPFEYAGVRSGAVTRGLRPYGSPDLTVSSPAAYEAALAGQGIILPVAERRAEIARQVEALAAEVGGRVPDDPGLLDEVTALVERPTALRGEFDREHLALPREVLVMVMRKHQRYWPVERDGRLLPYFIAVRNGDAEHLDVVRAGNEHVLRARFADATFFFSRDLETPLEGYRERLGTLTFQERLGSMLAKSERVEALSAQLAPALGLSDTETAIAVRAAHLAKADLVTRLVVEMTALQGLMGREYARRAGEPEQIAEAIFEHYLPRYAGDRLPVSRAGILVGLADRLDSLAGLFAIGLAPTGSADPYGLRRAALGLIAVLLERGIRLDLAAGLRAAAALQPVAVAPEAQQQALDFVAARLRGVLLETGLRYDVVDAALAARGHDPLLARETARALSAWVARPEWPALLAAYSRCVRITRGQPEGAPVRPEALGEPAERALHDALAAAQGQVTPAGTVDELFAALAPLVPVIDRFFVDIMVIAEDPEVRANRLALVRAIARLADGIVDLSKVEGF
jgi:glycyl-tRNA synthetase